jgi:H+-transporting ATPase
MAKDHLDVENGDPERERTYSKVDYTELDEYSALQKYITTYRDPKAAAAEDAEGAYADANDARKGRPWWAFWRSGSSPNAQGKDAGVVPDDWLNSDPRQGIKSSVVDERRRRLGANELTSEKENMFLKFLSFFTGPILYGTVLAAIGF